MTVLTRADHLPSGALPAEAGRCPACLGSRSRAAFSVGDHEFRRCGGCGSLYVAGPPPEDELLDLYDGPEYFRNAGYLAGDFHGYRDYLADRRATEAKFEAILSRMESLVPVGELLDVGAGPGLLLAVAKRRGWRPRGIDPNPWAAQVAHREAGVQVEVGTLAEAAIDPGRLDALTMMDLIEHIRDPESLLATSAPMVRPGGVLALLTPDAGSPTTRLLGRRWPEVQRAPEHLILYSVDGIAALLRRHGFEPLSWHSVGKTTSIGTLVADLRPLAPIPLGLVARALGAAGDRGEVHFDPRAKFCLYAIRSRPDRAARRDGPRRPIRTSGRAGRRVAEAIREDLEHLAAARRLGDWTFQELVGRPDAISRPLGAVAEVGAGIGNFSRRLLAAGADPLLLIEPDPVCANRLARELGNGPGVVVAQEELPDSPALAGGGFDLVVCQNVLEHVDDDAASVRSMARALRPGGRLALLVPADPALFGPLDLTYGHRRRYEAGVLRRQIAAAGLELERLQHFNLLGVLGWRLAGLRRTPRVGRASMVAYELLVRAWWPLERRLRPRRGLSLLCVARAPGGDGPAES